MNAHTIELERLLRSAREEAEQEARELEFADKQHRHADFFAREEVEHLRDLVPVI